METDGREVQRGDPPSPLSCEALCVGIDCYSVSVCIGADKKNSRFAVPFLKS